MFRNVGAIFEPCANSKQADIPTLLIDNFQNHNESSFPTKLFITTRCIHGTQEISVLHDHVLKECCCRVCCVNLTFICGSECRYSPDGKITTNHGLTLKLSSCVFACMYVCV